MRLLVAYLLMMSIAGRAHAEAPADAIRIGIPKYGAKVDRVALGLWVRSDRVAARLTFELSIASAESRDVELTFELPAGSRATGMVASLRGVRNRATVIDAEQARGAYVERIETLATGAESALLESAGGTGFHLRVPVASRAPASIELELSLPRGRTLAVTPVGHAIGAVDISVEGDGIAATAQRWTSVTAARSIPIPTPRVVAAKDAIVQERGVVDPALSLFAGTAIAPPVVTVTIGTPTSSCTSFGGKHLVRKYVKLQHPRLRYCYMRSAQRDPTLAGTVILSFRIQPDGSVTPGVFGGDLADDQVRSCLQAEVAAWKFPASDSASQITYPLTFRLAD